MQSFTQSLLIFHLTIAMITCEAAVATFESIFIRNLKVDDHFEKRISNNKNK